MGQGVGLRVAAGRRAVGAVGPACASEERMGKKKRGPVDQATPRIDAGAKGTPEAMVTEGNATVTRVLASPNIGSASGVSAAANAWSADLVALQTNNTRKKNARETLDTAITKEPQLVRACNAGKQGLLAAIN